MPVRNMQEYQQRLILVALFITLTYAETEINSFDASEPDTDENYSTVYANHIKLWANVTDCLSPACECKVQTDGLEDEPRILKFSTEKENVGSVDISNLESNTNYSFILTCEGQSVVNETLNIKTDYGRPSAPQNITAALIAKRVQVTWLPPSIPEDSFSYYKIIIDENPLSLNVSKNENPLSLNVSKNETSYRMSKDYKDGMENTFIVSACYINNQKEIFCSDKNGANASFSIPVTITPSSTGIHSYSISIFMIIFSYFFINQMK